MSHPRLQFPILLAPLDRAGAGRLKAKHASGLDRNIVSVQPVWKGQPLAQSFLDAAPLLGRGADDMNMRDMSVGIDDEPYWDRHESGADERWLYFALQILVPGIVAETVRRDIALRVLR